MAFCVPLLFLQFRLIYQFQLGWFFFGCGLTAWRWLGISWDERVSALDEAHALGARITHVSRAGHMHSLPLFLSLSLCLFPSLGLLHLVCSRFENKWCFLVFTIRQPNYINEMSLFNFTMFPHAHPLLSKSKLPVPFRQEFYMMLCLWCTVMLAYPPPHPPPPPWWPR